MKYVLKVLLLGAALTGFAGTSLAETGTPNTAKKAAAPKKAQAAKKPTKKGETAAAAQGDDEVDVAKSTAVDMHCALGDKVTLYHNAEDSKHIGMRWKKLLARLEQVSTTTGAQRYESKRHGLVWIGIPSKGMLLDSRKGQQLANDCRTPEQMAMHHAAPPAQSELLQEAKK